MPACPVCNAAMEAETRHGISVDVCSRHGLWLDHGELLRLTQAERQEHGAFEWADFFRTEQRPPRDEARVLSCPHCEGKLRQENYHEVIIDWCPTHGVWLDNGELDAILNNLRLDPSYLRGVRVRIADARY